MANIEGGIWAGADAENYLKGVDGLYTEGLFSKASILNYWPAGYPILLWILALISSANFFYLIGFLLLDCLAICHSFRSLYFFISATTSSIIASSVFFGSQPIAFLIFVISGTRRCISSKPAG